ncbi:hypothetical protein DM02DRAFT_631965 [Periconia macrospinosa]|uniref:Globin-sensor domain-containing protein n=1 Tax=Periconia macrospinosa TaxID=97972 RepID=A0A2V1DEL3_9PLEO|nr:hypothetical protein DM02DRAFT_631965 [Periconia macrospinosa]
MTPFPRRPIQHIDRRELYTNLEARISYLHSFLDFSSRDIEALTTGAKYIRALIPAIVNIVYKKLLQYDITARAFSTRSTSYEGPVDLDYDAAVVNGGGEEEGKKDDEGGKKREGFATEESPQIKHRKAFLRGYLNRLCSDPRRVEFWEYLNKLGHTHSAHPSSPSTLHIEYMHMALTLSLTQDVLTEAILSHPRLPMPRKIALVKALSKVIWIQNDLFAKWYVRDGEEFEDTPEDDDDDGGEGARLVPEVEPEGWVNGKRVVRGVRGEDEVGIEECGGLVGRSSCPFKDLGARAGARGAGVRTRMMERRVAFEDGEGSEEGSSGLELGEEGEVGFHAR